MYDPAPTVRSLSVCIEPGEAFGGSLLVLPRGEPVAISRSWYSPTFYKTPLLQAPDMNANSVFSSARLERKSADVTQTHLGKVLSWAIENPCVGCVNYPARPIAGNVPFSSSTSTIEGCRSFLM